MSQKNKYKLKAKRGYWVNGKWMPVGSIDCAGRCGCLTFGPLDGRKVYCQACG